MGKCSTSWFHSLLFVKENVKKIHSSSTKPKTCTMAILATLKYLNMVFFKTIELDNLHHNFVNVFTSYGGSIAIATHDYMVHLNVLAWKSNDDSDKIEEDCSQLVFIFVRNGFRRARCWTKFYAFGWSKYWRTIIPMAFVKWLVWKLVVSSLVKELVAPTKPTMNIKLSNINNYFQQVIFYLQFYVKICSQNLIKNLIKLFQRLKGIVTNKLIQVGKFDLSS
jgi:hypothetical protein